LVVRGIRRVLSQAEAVPLEQQALRRDGLVLAP
jgi:hypothetical protein